MKNLTIAFEIELESNDTNINLPKEFFLDRSLMFGNNKISKEKQLIENTRSYAIDKIKKYLPNFYSKYNYLFNCTFDKTLINGIEIVNKSYFDNVNDSIKYIKDFYKDFDKQSFWKMNNNTSIHINIGVNGNVKWNIPKCVLSIDEDFVFKGLESVRNKYKNLTDDLDYDGDLKQQLINKVIKSGGGKSYFLNIQRIITSDYLEFRYIIGYINIELFIEKLLYFCKLVDSCTSYK